MDEIRDLFSEELVNELKSLYHPAVKKAISDIVTNGIDMILYGESGGTRKRSTASKVSYSRYYDDRFRDRREPAIEPQLYSVTSLSHHDGGHTVSCRKYDKHMLNNRYGAYQIKKVIFNYPATIVFWSDGSKTVVKASGDDVYDPEKGLAIAICKKFMGNSGNYYNEFKKWLPEDKEAK